MNKEKLHIFSDKPHTPFLKGEPRIHYDDLEVFENTKNGESEFHYQNKPFNGIAWCELKGTITEDTMQDGVLHGRCIKIHANGQMAEDALYNQDEPIGEVYQWYDTGVVSHYASYNNDGNLLISRDYNTKGIVTKEIDHHSSQRLRHWSDNGILIYESNQGQVKCYTLNGKCVIEKQGDITYQHDELYKNAAEILSAKINLANYLIWDWLHHQLNNHDKKARQLLFQLTHHPVTEVAKTAIRIIGNKGYSDAIPLITSLTTSKCKNKENRNLTETIAELAQITLIKLTGNGNIEHTRILQNKQRHFIELQEEQRRIKVKKQWPKTKAIYVESYLGELTLKHGDQLFSNKHLSKNINHLHVYKYIVDKKTYKAIINSNNPAHLASISIQYRAKNPEEYFI
jgi:antitoxin component YwqK of YwqJK toxin-antitoxin module